MRNNKLCLIRVKINQPRSKSDILNTTNLFAFTQKYFHPLPPNKEQGRKTVGWKLSSIVWIEFYKTREKKKKMQILR